MKIYDFDGMFDEKLSEYISQNPRKYSEDEWEDMIPRLYKKFGDSKIKSLGKTPREFYKDMSDGELIGQLKSHFKKEVPVSAFLCEEIESRNLTESLLSLLDGSAEERDFAMNLLGADDRAVKKYIDLLVSGGDDGFKSRCAEYIKEKADLVIEEALGYYAAGTEKEYMCEILSRSVLKDDRILDALLKEFRTDPENISAHAAYLAAYGDERALVYLTDKIEEEGITYAEFRELKFAIETLGGTYDKERDFSDDPLYKLLKARGDASADIFSLFEKDKNE